MNKRGYIQANKDWLEAKSKEEGVKALPKGIYYKVLSEGNQSSATPTVRSIITAHYTGKTINMQYNSYLLNLEELKSLRQKDFSKEELVKMVKESMKKEELLSLLLDK